MFFKSLQPILKGCISLSVILAAGEGDMLTITVLPKPKASGEDAAVLSTPLSLTGTIAELDEKFAEIIGKYDAARIDLEEQLETTTAVLDAAKKASSSKATSALKKTSQKSDAQASASGSSSSKSASGDDETDDETATAGATIPVASTASTAVAAEVPNLFS